MTTPTAALDQLAITTIRTLAMDAVEQAASGHPGTPMALAPVAYLLWSRFLRYDPATPDWPARDRFVLSCGHASMLLYALLHLAGVRAAGKDGPAISLEHIRRFRQLGSPCAGHPEWGAAAGIETTTGPLGQGVGNSVGMALAARWLAARYNRPGFALLGNNVYVLCSDGDMMEGVGCEAASLAGHLGLSNLCWIYDDNHVTIDGRTSLAFSEDVERRFAALGWHTVRVDDANDLSAIESALTAFQTEDQRPTLIAVRSVIAWGAPHKADSHEAHGAPLGADEVRLTKAGYGWPATPPFLVPPEVPAHLERTLGRRGAAAYRDWQAVWTAYRNAHPELAAELEAIFQGRLPDGWEQDLPTFSDQQSLATRAASGKVLKAIASRVAWFVGGSADLGASTKTLLDNAISVSATHPGGRNLHFGVREHGMAAIANGLALTGLRPYASTFLVFSDYLRPAMRLAAIMHQPVLFIFTHDSIGLGEDGPTHQPVEHLAACRAIPGLVVVRPADANEVVEAYRTILAWNNRPAALILTRQDVPTLSRQRFASAELLRRGAYVLADPEVGAPDVILIGTGSEVHICVAAYEPLVREGIKVRLVSMPSFELFAEQDAGYQESVLPASVWKRIAVEAGVKQGWERFLGPHGRFIGMESFGASAPHGDLYRYFEITPERVVAEVRRMM